MDLPLLRPLLRDLRTRGSLALENTVPALSNPDEVLTAGVSTAIVEVWVFDFVDTIDDDLRVVSEAPTITAAGYLGRAFTCLPVANESIAYGSEANGRVSGFSAMGFLAMDFTPEHTLSFSKITTRVLGSRSVRDEDRYTLNQRYTRILAQSPVKLLE
ncbi:hypothetical protein NL676_035051 [Syzygium grande]|nr:hypothetical protein NL676_035051 [Syzygium grande]